MKKRGFNTLTYSMGSNSRRQNETAMQFVQLDMQKMKRVVLNLEDTGANLLAKVPGDLTQTVENIIAQTQAIGENAKEYNPTRIDAYFQKVDDYYDVTRRRVESDVIDSEVPQQSASFIESFTNDIKNRLIEETKGIETNVKAFVDGKLKGLDQPETQKLVFEMPELFPTQVPDAKTIKLPRQDCGPVNKLLIKQSDYLDDLMKSLSSESAKEKEPLPMHDPETVYNDLVCDKIALTQLLNNIKMYNLEERMKPRKTKKSIAMKKEELEQRVDIEELKNFKEYAINSAKELDNNLEEAKKRVESRVESLRAKLDEQEARVAQFDEVVAALEEKITYLQFLSDDVLDNTLEEKHDVGSYLNGINVYTNQLEKNQNALMEKMESQIHRIELSIPL